MSFLNRLFPRTQRAIAWFWSFALGVLWLGALPAWAEDDLFPMDIEGDYTCKGVQDGRPYTGRGHIQAQGEVYRATWVVSSVRYEGVGILQGRTLSMAWANTQSPRERMGVTVYRLDKNGNLRGRWTARYAHRIYQETCSPEF